ncbi:hypothetical protein V7x_11330 [Crateriforma conspicua]|uniref:Uncharacterized protein n=2 Tax=Planctomycetaceae TaxID=126 RepID=A0A5C6FVF1_9PLAN|nr:hypothetical protein V7x_11330 [Crateriforma conspicua]
MMISALLHTVGDLLMHRSVSWLAGIAAVACVFTFAAPASATSDFARAWKEAYLAGDDVDADFVKTARKAGCYVCHIKGHPKKKEVRNEYGKAIHEFLKKEDFPKDYLKEKPEEAKKKMVEGFKKAGEKKSSDGEKFADKIKAGKLPATDAEL